MIYLIRFISLGLILLSTGSSLRAQDYYTVQQIEQAKARARQLHLPIAWMSSPIVYLNSNYAYEKQGSIPELTNLALRTLQGQAVVIIQNVDDDLPNMPANMVDRIEIKDEGELPGGFHYNAPKIIYTDPDLKTILGCTISPDLREDREAAINIALLHIHNDPASQALIKGTPPASVVVVADQPTTAPPTITKSADTLALVSDLASYFVYIASAIVILIFTVAYFVWRGRTNETAQKTE